MRRHLHWVLLLLAAPVAYVVFMWFASVMLHRSMQTHDIGWGLGEFAAILAAVFVPVILLIRSIVHMVRTYRRAQRAKGRYTKTEQRMLERGAHAANAWEHARLVRAELLAHRVPGTIRQWDVVPYPDEVFFARLMLTYARYYGTDVAYRQTSTFAFGRPAFVVGALAVGAIANASARSRATAQASPQWRDWQPTAVYVSNRRIVVDVGGQWLSFDYSTIVAMYPEAGSWTLICQFPTAVPLLLSGDEAPIAAVFAVMQTYGAEALRDHPGLQALNTPATQPSLPPVGKAR
ncbi:hypothetical protein ET475_04870 [Microbacterium protaetiae]|uniref:Uncharacterized protein n=1 Tax=Microbacterium protaetiae TaxID=2509458 RepID=A0A4P6EE88_9MICO|nr:hypothetical protein [Microbacterium protaetiae]QAY59389.1 hypothetical protein ET475_04870 [Microbacterium protaetiae]